MSNRLAKKIARQYLNSQPLRLRSDYGDRNAADFLGEDLMAEMWKGSRLPSRKHNPDSVVDKAVEQWRKDNPEVAKKFDEEKVNSKEEMKEKLKLSDEMDQDRTASHITIDSVLDSKGKEVHLFDTIEHKGSKAVVTELFYDSGRRVKYVAHQHSNGKRMTVPASEVTLVSKDPYRKSSGHEESGSYMSRQNLREMSDISDFLVDNIGLESLEDWVEDKISQAYAALSDVARYRGYRDDHSHGEDSFKFAGRKMTPFEIVTNWFAQAEEESEGEIEYMMGVDGDDEMSGDVEILSGHDIPSLIRDLKRDLRWSNIEFSKSGRRTISWGLPTQSRGFEGEHFRYANDEIIDDLEW